MRISSGVTSFLLITSSLGWVPTVLGQNSPKFIESHIKPAENLASFVSVDLDIDGREDLIVVTHEDGRRSLNIYYQSKDGAFPSQPDKIIKVLGDIIGYAVADVREDPGRELVLMTRSVLYAYSPTKDGYRDNATKLIESDILYTVPDPEDVSRWPYIMSSEESPFETLLLVNPEGYEIWAPNRDGRYQIASRLNGFMSNDAVRGRSVAVRAAFFDIRVHQDSVRFITEESRYSLRGADNPILLDMRYGQRAPVFADVDADGQDDLILQSGRKIHVFIARGFGQFGRTPDRSEVLPDSIDADETLIEAIDLNKDGFADLVMRPDRDSGGGDDSQKVKIYLGDEDALVHDSPNQVIKVDALGIQVQVADINGDSRPDLTIVGTQAPFGPESIAGIRLERDLYVHFGRPNGLFERRPDIKRTTVYKPDDIRALEFPLSMEGDFNGDGFHDWLETTKDGAVHIRFLDPKDLQIESEASLKYQPRRRPQEVLVAELDEDGTNDLIVKLPDELVIFVSQ